MCLGVLAQTYAGTDQCTCEAAPCWCLWHAGRKALQQAPIPLWACRFLLEAGRWPPTVTTHVGKSWCVRSARVCRLLKGVAGALQLHLSDPNCYFRSARAYCGKPVLPAECAW
jgi:hypothetical protein